MSRNVRANLAQTKEKMMTVSRNKKTLITSDHPKGRQTSDLFRAAYDRAKLDEDRAQILNERGGEFQAYIIAGIKQITSNSASYVTARHILGRNFIAPDQITTEPQFSYSDYQLDKLRYSFPNLEQLMWCLEHNMVLMPGPPMTISFRYMCDIYDWGDIVDELEESGQEKVLNEEVRPLSWIAFVNGPVRGSACKTWREQKSLVKAPLVIPSAVEALWRLFVRRRTWDSNLMDGGYYLRTSSVWSDGVHVEFNPDELGDATDDERTSTLGVAACRRF